MRRFSRSLLALLLIGCSGVDDPPPPACGTSTAGFNTAPVMPGMPGTFVGATVKDGSSTPIAGVATAYQQGSATAAFTVLNAFTTDAQNRPTGELFLFLRGPAKVGTVPVVPVTLAQIRDENFVPTGAFAVYADGYDPNVGDYSRWLLGAEGCIQVSAASGPTRATTAFRGSWQNSTGSALGDGSASAQMTAPLLDLRTTSGEVDNMFATASGVRARPFATGTLDSYQLLHPDQTRLVVVGTQPADTTREIWLSIAGVPQTGDSIALGAPTLAEARAGRMTSGGSFGMLRLLELDNTGKPIVREIWRSTTGWVKFYEMIQNGPLALCGFALGTFAMTTQGVSLAAPATDLGVTTVTGGNFRSRITVVSQADTLVDPAVLPAISSRMRLMAPSSESGLACP